MKVHFDLKTLFLVSSLSFTLFSCDKDDPWAGTHTGEESNFGMGKARTYITNDKDGNPVEIGVILTQAAFDNFTELSGDEEVSLVGKRRRRVGQVLHPGTQGQIPLRGPAA